MQSTFHGISFAVEQDNLIAVYGGLLQTTLNFCSRGPKLRKYTGYPDYKKAEMAL